MNVKKTLARVLTPVADKAGQATNSNPCTIIFHQPKLPKKLEKTVK